MEIHQNVAAAAKSFCSSRSKPLRRAAVIMQLVAKRKLQLRERDDIDRFYNTPNKLVMFYSEKSGFYNYFAESDTDSLDAALDELGSECSEDEIRLVRIKFISEMAN